MMVVELLLFDSVRLCFRAFHTIAERQGLSLEGTRRLRMVIPLHIWAYAFRIWLAAVVALRTRQAAHKVFQTSTRSSPGCGLRNEFRCVSGSNKSRRRYLSLQE